MAEHAATPGAGDDPDGHHVATLRARAVALAAPHVRPDPAGTAHLVVLATADRRYAVPAEQVVEVLAPGPTIPLPRRGHQLAGARPRRGDLLPVVDPGRATGGGDVAGAPDACFVVVLDGAEPLGLLATSVTTIETSGAIDGVVGAADVVRGVTTGGIVVLSPDLLLADPRFRAGR